jgi:acyl-coenzyme A synthetase/AMP-(fatty) acid ligase
MLNMTFRAERNFNMVWGPQLVMVPDNTLPATIALLRSVHSGHLFLAPRETAKASLELAAEMGVRQLFVTPMSLRELVDAAKSVGHGLTDPRVTMFGAMADRSLLMEAREVFGPEIDVFYGTAENGLAGAGRFDPETHVPGWCGRVADGTDLVIRDNGHLAYRVPEDERSHGYLGGPDFLDGDGWFETGDLATLLEGQTIVLRGREDNLINLGGSKFAAELVEMLACDFPFIREAVALQLPESIPGMPELGVAVVADAPADLEALRLMLALKLRTRAPITVRSLPGLPRLPSDKVDRRAALAALTAT